MPVEIRELVIRAAVTAENDSSAESTSSSDTEKEQIIEECVQQVMDILKRNQER